MIKVCIFDLDGTLARTQASIARPVNMTLARYGLPAQPVEAFNYFAGDGMKMLFSEHSLLQEIRTPDTILKKVFRCAENGWKKIRVIRWSLMNT